MERSSKLAFSVAEAAVHADVCRDNIYSAIREGRLSARKAGRRTLILRTDLEAYLSNLPRLELSNASQGRLVDTGGKRLPARTKPIR